MAPMKCDTITIDVPSRWSDRMRSRHLDWNAMSPTASTSSTTRMLGSECTAAEKPSRMNIPDE